MSDPLRTEPARAGDAATDEGRDAKIEQLLLAGLDHYFAARYEQAINVWTRALFLDRSHARARAYIERARSALAERHRECEELIHTGLAAFDRGDGDEARRLLRSALSHGAPSEEALAVLERLERLDRGRGGERGTERVTGSTASRGAWSVGAQDPRPFARSTWIALGALIFATGLFVVGSSGSRWQALFGTESQPPAATPTTADSLLPLPRQGEMALARARALAASGRFHDALSHLDLVRPTDPQKSDADQLRGDIQRQLLALTAVDRAAGLGLPSGGDVRLR